MAGPLMVNGKPFYRCTAAELRQAAADRHEAERRSFERCDTDGFLSQWAHSITARQFELQAQIAERGGCYDFLVLVDAETGEVVSRHTVPGGWRDGVYFKPAWRIPHGLRDRYGRGFVPTGERSRIQKQLGLREATEAAPARAELMGSGTGLSGCASAYVGAVRVTEG